jgi:hypothetical protein
MIKTNEVAFVKTTGEAVFVISASQADGNVHVRRPVAGQDGIRHVVDEFLPEELESLDEQRARFMAERKEVLEKFGPKADQPNASGDPGFGLN